MEPTTQQKSRGVGEGEDLPARDTTKGSTQDVKPTEAATPPTNTGAGAQAGENGATPGSTPGSSKKTKADIMKAEEDKLKGKYPGIKSGKSEFLRNRMAKKKVYFDSGEYNMIQERQSKKRVSQAPVILAGQEGSGTGSSEGESDHEEAIDCVPSLLPNPNQQTMPTPEELLMRRASLYMPRSNPVPEQVLFRRATIQAQRMLSTGNEANPLEILGDRPALSPEHLMHKKTPSVPSKLVMDG